MSCLVLGDSIAKGLGGVLKGCLVIAKVGMTSAWILAHTPSLAVSTAYVSAGTNDLPRYEHLAQNLKAISHKINAQRTIWVAPSHKVPNRIVHAQGYAVDFIPGKDGLHPRSYYALAQSVLKLDGALANQKPILRDSLRGQDQRLVHIEGKGPYGVPVPVSSVHGNGRHHRVHICDYLPRWMVPLARTLKCQLVQTLH